MTPELIQRLESKLPPFDGPCIHSIGNHTLSQLRELLVTTASLLSPSYAAIHSFHDWHEHDGFIMEPKSDSWDAIYASTVTDRILFDSRDDDFQVRIAYFSPSFDWLLRYNIDQEDGTHYDTATCDFDLSVAEHVADSRAFDELFARFSNVLTRCESQAWFRLNYGG